LWDVLYLLLVAKLVALAPTQAAMASEPRAHRWTMRLHFPMLLTRRRLERSYFMR